MPTANREAGPQIGNSISETVTKFGHTYVWHRSLGFWTNKEGRVVQIFPPTPGRPDWWVVIPDEREIYNLRGNAAEDRAFSSAAGYITQPE